jgi:carbon monoxide dehydrogenase subunit G
MKMEQSFEVAAPVERVWKALIDVEYVAPCLPGAAITGRDDEGHYTGTFTVKLGPTTAAYNGVLRIEDVDEAAHRATLHARGTDKRGQGGATATIVNTVVDAGGGTTRVEAVTDFTITGRLARFGRGGMIEDISNRMLREFSQCLQAKLGAEEEPATAGETAAAAAPPSAADAGGEAPPPTSAPPVRGISLFLSVLWERIKRAFKRS